MIDPDDESDMFYDLCDQFPNLAYNHRKRVAAMTDPRERNAEERKHHKWMLKVFKAIPGGMDIYNQAERRYQTALNTVYREIFSEEEEKVGKIGGYQIWEWEPSNMQELYDRAAIKAFEDHDHRREFRETKEAGMIVLAKIREARRRVKREKEEREQALKEARGEVDPPDEPDDTPVISPAELQAFRQQLKDIVQSIDKMAEEGIFDSLCPAAPEEAEETDVERQSEGNPQILQSKPPFAEADLKLISNTPAVASGSESIDPNRSSQKGKEKEGAIPRNVGSPDRSHLTAPVSAGLPAKPPGSSAVSSKRPQSNSTKKESRALPTQQGGPSSDSSPAQQGLRGGGRGRGRANYDNSSRGGRGASSFTSDNWRAQAPTGREALTAAVQAESALASSRGSDRLVEAQQQEGVPQSRMRRNRGADRERARELQQKFQGLSFVNRPA